MSIALRSVRLALAASALLAGAAGAARAADNWDLLKSLAGEWEGASDKSKDPVRISYQVISAGSVVMETMQMPDGKPMMVTMYHRDGGSLMVTHYCAVGNQPRMRAPLAAEGRKIAFRFMDATNLQSPAAPHMRDLTLTSPDAGQLVQEWTSREGGKDSTTVFRLRRRDGLR